MTAPFAVLGTVVIMAIILAGVILTGLLIVEAAVGLFGLVFR